MDIKTEGQTTGNIPKHGTNHPPERTVVEDHEKRREIPVEGRRQPAHEGARERAHEAKAKAGEKLQEAKERAKSEGKFKAAGIMQEGKNQAARGLENAADTLSGIGDQFRERDQEGFGKYADRTSHRIRDFSDYLQEREPDEIVYDLQSAARRQPWITIGGAFIAGMVAARFLKASREQ